MRRPAIAFGVPVLAAVLFAAACSTGGPTIGRTVVTTSVDPNLPGDEVTSYPPSDPGVVVAPPTDPGRADAEAEARDSSDEDAGPLLVVPGDEVEAGGPELTADASLTCAVGQARCEVGCCQPMFYCLDLEAGHCPFPPPCLPC